MGGGVVDEEVVQAIGEIGAESLENRCGAARGAEAAERGEVGESDEHLGLVVVVAIVAQRRVQSETGGGLRGEGLRGVIPAGVDLQRKRLLRSDDFEQVGQTVTEGSGHAVTEHAAGIGRDRGVEVLPGGEA